MIATLMRFGTNDCQLNDMRAYDAWGGIRSGATTGDPAPRHSANLGHVQDDENGFVYMRARYYEPTSGRFVSEDLGMAGSNWSCYNDNDPLNKVDFSGKTPLHVYLFGIFATYVVMAVLVAAGAEAYHQYKSTGEVYSLGRVAAKGVQGLVIAALGAIVVGVAVAYSQYHLL